MRRIVIAAAGLLLLLTGCGPTAQGPATPTATLAAASSYVDTQAKYAHVVVVSVQEVQAGVQVLGQDGGDPAAAASFQQLLSQAEDSFDAAGRSFSSFGLAVPDGLDDANTEAATAIRELSDAMSSARAYVDSQKPSDLADYSTHWEQGRKWWNDAVTKLWGAAQQSPPTV